MNNTNTTDLPLADKLKTEQRTCPTCHLEVPSPFIERCPRCFSLLPHIDVDCNGCMHKIMCPVVKGKE